MEIENFVVAGYAMVRSGLCKTVVEDMLALPVLEPADRLDVPSSPWVDRWEQITRQGHSELEYRGRWQTV